MLAFPELNKTTKQAFTISAFEGLDRRTSAGEKTLFHTENMSSQNLPVLSTRKGRKKLFTVEAGEKITGIYGLDKAYMTTEFEGHTRLYIGEDFSSLECIFTSNDDELVSSLLCKFGTKVCIFNLKTGIDDDTMAGVIPNAPANSTRYPAPTFNDVIVYADRIIGCRRNQIRACAYDDLFNWDHNKEGVEEEVAAFYSSHELKSDFTACTTYKNRAVFLTSDEMFEFVGNDSTQFDIVKIADVGCINRRALCEVDGELYFVSKEGVMKYSGSLPVMVSDELCNIPRGVEASLSGAGRTLYVKFDGERESSLYSYNTETRLWSREDSVAAVDLTNYVGHTYLATETELFKLDVDISEDSENNDGADFSWQFTLQENHNYCPLKKRTSHLDFYINQPFPNKISVYAAFDGGDFTLMQTVIGKKNGIASVLIRPRAYDSIKIKICGKGQADIHYLTQTFSLGGRK